MNDVLRRLALRALGRSDGIRPHLPGRFEPNGFPAAEPAGPLETPRAPVTSAAAMPILAPVAPSAAPAVIQRKADQSAFRPAAAASAEPVRATTEASQAAPAAEFEPSFAATRAALASRPARDIATDLPPASRPAAARPASFTPLLPDLAMPEPIVENSRQAPPPPLASAPDVHISIGRVEVRADPAERRPQARPSPRVSPLMSLEDYLSKGRERRR